MKIIDRIKKESPTILAIIGSVGTGVTAYLAARNEAIYQNKRFDYHLEHGMFPEECSANRKDGYKLIRIHLKQHLTTFISGGLTIGSIIGSSIAGKKQNAALVGMSLGISNMIANRKEAEDAVIEKQNDEEKGYVSREQIQDYLINEAYHNDLVYYTTIENVGDDEELVWLDFYPVNKIFVLERNDVNSLQWFINCTLKEQDHVSFGEIFDYLNIYRRVSQDFVDDDINEWVTWYGFSKDHNEFMNIEVYCREVKLDDDTVVTALSLSKTPDVIEII